MSVIEEQSGTVISLPGLARPSKACGDDYSRPALSQGWVVEQDKDSQRFLVTTDSYIMCRTPVPDDTPLGPISGDAIRHIEDGGQHRVKDGKVVRREEGVKTTWKPRYTAAPSLDGAVFDGEAAEMVVIIGLNAQFLIRLAEAIGAHAGELKIEIPVTDGTTHKPIRVTALNPSIKAEGLIMPMVVRDDR